MDKKMPFKPKMNLDYLGEKPTRINYKIIAGGRLHPIQMYDIVFDEYDYRIRGMVKDGRTEVTRD